MNIHFKKVRLYNFLSFGDSEIMLDEGGYILVRGENNNVDDLATSNGSGKSSIWEAISWAITGQTIRGTKNVVNMNSEGGTFVELEFNIDNNNYRILRSKDHKEYKTNLKVYINGEDKSGKGIRDTEQLLLEYLPDLTSSLIGSVIILGQGLPQRFSNNTPSGRKEVLEKLSKSDFMIADLKDRISNRKKTLSDKLRTIEDNILKLSTEKSVIEKLILEDKNKLSTMSTSESLIKEKTNLESSLTALEDKYNQLHIEVNQQTEEVNKCNEELLKLNNEYSEKISTISQHEDYIKYNTLSANLINAQAELNSLKAEITRLDAITDTCPTCGQKLLGVSKPDTTGLKTKYNTLLTEIEQIKEDKNNAEKSYQEYQNKIKAEYNSSIASKKQTISELNNILNNLKVELSNKQKEIETVKNSILIAEKNIQHYAEQINELNNRIIYNETELVDFGEKIQYNINMKENTDKKLSIVNKMNTIITRDFRGYLLQNSIEFINNKAKEYSKEVFDTDKLDFQLDGNSISISYDGKEYENLSGGEKQKIDLIVQLSLRDMLCKHLNFSSNILVLDELFDNLDSIGCQRVLNLIATKLNDVESIFIVTHHSDIAIPVDRELVVIKDSNKISKVK